MSRPSARSGWTRQPDDAAGFYALFWPGADILKVGITFNFNRFRDLVTWNAVVTPAVVLYERDAQVWWEKGALWALASAGYPPGFPNAATAELLLRRGSGWTECFKVPVHEVVKARDIIEEGIERYGAIRDEWEARAALDGPSARRAPAPGSVDRGRPARPRRGGWSAPDPRGHAQGRDLAARRDGQRR